MRYPSYSFTLQDLAANGPQREAVENWLEGEVDRIDLGDTYDDILDRLDGYPWEVKGEWHSLELPEQTTDPVYKRLRSIAQQVRRETRD